MSVLATLLAGTREEDWELLWGEEPSWSVGKEGEMVGERGHTEAFDKGWGEAARARGRVGRGEDCAALDGMESQPPPSSTGGLTRQQTRTRN